MTHPIHFLEFVEQSSLKMLRKKGKNHLQALKQSPKLGEDGQGEDFQLWRGIPTAKNLIFPLKSSNIYKLRAFKIT